MSEGSGSKDQLYRVLFRCPNLGRSVPTGFTATREAFATLSIEDMLFECECGRTHAITTSRLSLSDQPEPRQN